MVTWALSRDPARVVDAGCGSGRYASAVAQHDPDVQIVAVDIDPVATLLTRANLAVLGARNARVVNADYMSLELPLIDGRTAFIGNPPYVRHHELPAELKAWAAAAGRGLGHPVSPLSGLHTHFFLATALLARPGDIGTFITSSEWLDVGYGSAIRKLLLDRLGGISLTAFHPSSTAFTDVMTTAVIASFEAGARPQFLKLAEVVSVDELERSDIGQEVDRTILAAATRWTSLLRSGPRAAIDEASGKLSDFARVHRGQVTGGNSFFVLTRQRARELGLEQWCRPAITSAEEVLESGGVIRDSAERKLLLCPPRDTDRKLHPKLDQYLASGEAAPTDGHPSVSERYVPRHRAPWWHLGKIPTPPIVASYMARRPPAFALNPDRLALLNIGHGIWPNSPMPDERLASLVTHLNSLRESFQGAGRTYHGGLEKFEPREMEELRIPGGDRWRVGS